MAYQLVTMEANSWYFSLGDAGGLYFFEAAFPKDLSEYEYLDGDAVY